MNQLNGWSFTLSQTNKQQQMNGLCITPQGKPAMVSNTALIKQSIQILLSTSPGERVMRPEYGCKLDKLVFAKNDDTTAGLAIHYVSQALALWEPRIDVLDIDATSHPHQPELLEIQLKYRIKSSYEDDHLNYLYHLEGESV
ncbi:MAG: Unknown protein [uncultured Thiotrichaceae bacterium]|uniref:IraD/Gp25-like domain-containing protein n=1 Tax=uncultured Thiotrichaceae bacterium TaxID=298394 RepID=A0A6S6SM83_9GAMM|nr:MAG: Unknown protein [uncultured Thiotrichaceae bacterium]